MILVLMVAAGGFAGGFLRWFLARLMPGKPATFSANILACVVAGAVLISNFSDLGNALFVTGFCGALSTWSTLARELGQLLKDRRWRLLSGYVSATLTAGLAVAWLTRWLVSA